MTVFLLLLANLVAVIHGLSVAAVVIGSVAAICGALRRYPRWRVAFYALLAGVILSDLLLGECLLTGLEQRLRNLAVPGAAYRSSFIGHYLPWLPHWIHADIGPALVIAALLAYPAWRWRRR